ncbi:hypothetical protein BGW80DRAFT_1435593 [Lactifluus volemus]|nr:hypothetical protein BGW80DRAFT_1435593 [Lactifluus volemus]
MYPCLRLADGFLDFALALPWPPSFPPYSSTIILLAVVSRLAFTIPFSVWDLVVPALKEERPLVQQQILHEMRVEQPRGTKEELRQMYSKRVQKAMIARRNALFVEHRCGPWLTMLIPPLTQLPLFVGSSMFLSRLSQPPTSSTSLRWFISDAAKERDELERKRIAEKRAQGLIVLQPRNILQSALRLLSVGRILIAAVVPGSVVLYWLSSATFGLLQSWVFDYWERRRSNLQRLTTASQQSVGSSSSAATSRGKPVLAPASLLKWKRK